MANSTRDVHGERSLASTAADDGSVEWAVLDEVSESPHSQPPCTTSRSGNSAPTASIIHPFFSVYLSYLILFAFCGGRSP